MSELTMDQEIQLNQRPSPQRQQQAQEHGGATAPAPAPATPQDDEQQGHQAAVARHGCGGATAERHHQTKLTLLPLVFLIYFEVAGGPYGAEQAVSAAGPLFALLGFLAFPFAWGVPVSLVTAEIAAPLPGNGGFVVWADRAFGPLAGSLLGTWKYLSCVINLAAFPALVADYLGRVAPAVAVPGSRARTGTVLGMTVFLSFLNLGGLSTVGWGAVALGFVSLAPFVLMTAMAAPRTRPRRWAARVHVKGKRDWRLFFNTLLWNLNYWDSASTMAGEVERPERTFPRALAVAVVLIAVSYLLPLMAAVGATDAPPEAWENGYLADAAGIIGGRWLKYWTEAGAVLSSVGLFEAQLSSGAFQLLGMAELGLLPSVFARRGPGRSATPWVAVAASAAVSVAVSFLGFDDVVATANLLYSLGALLEFAAFLRLRAREESPSSLKRPYRVPLPLPALAAMCLVPSAFLAYVVAVAGWRVSAVAAALTALGVGWHGAMRVCRSRKWLRFNTVVAAGPHLQLQDDPPAADRV
ncbi:probable polyamine transporter At3g13620 isoform X4 [Oryza glaberrima]|uniref:probable polyamine transporter At3g13620 isoform X4 n=1 Tax=Oryza glaberrima TaxID=4538 RepID=UPI00224BEC72|nr:probable polyamine transporter At3g13620 isoform X4 [Oryza glaberrima]